MAEKHRVIFTPSGKVCETESGRTILECAIDAGVEIRSDCGGKMACGKCSVKAEPSKNISAPSQDETELLKRGELAPGERLACKAKILGPVFVTVPEINNESDYPTKAALHGTFPVGKEAAELPEGSLGIAFDIGTTTLAAYLCDMKSGELLHSVSSTNPQIRFGEDVISRIAYANEKGIDRLRKLVIDEANLLIESAVNAIGASKEKIIEAVVVGNPAMQHIFSGLHPQSLGIAPYAPVTSEAIDSTAGEFGLAMNPEAKVHVFPVISGFVGGDTLAAVLSERPQDKEELTLVVDIGTNGELVLGNREGLLAASCATGPALEGAHISCGMRATHGAIYKAEEGTFASPIRFHIFGEEENPNPAGICGSGLIDIIAILRREWIILPTGRFNEDMPGVISDSEGIGRRYVLVTEEETANRREISLSLDDIRQIQLAKAALATGIRLLMKRIGTAHIDRIVLTGAFGARFGWKNAVSIGMLPECASFSKIQTADNAAGRGAVLALLDRNKREEAAKLARMITPVELAEEPGFATEFPLAMSFPD